MVDKFQYDIDKIDKWTLGKTWSELERNKLRPDFILLLKSIVDYRNYIAHELLANKVLMDALLENKIPESHYDKEQGDWIKQLLSWNNYSFYLLGLTKMMCGINY